MVTDRLLGPIPVDDDSEGALLMRVAVSDRLNDLDTDCSGGRCYHSPTMPRAASPTKGGSGGEASDLMSVRS